MTAYQAKILAQELAKSDYNGMTLAQGWAWLTQPTITTQTVATGKLLTPTDVAAASMLGPAKAEAIAAAVKSTFPTIADLLLTSGIDPSDPGTQAFIGGLVTASTLTSGDAAKLAAVAAKTTTVTTEPRFGFRFTCALWPHVAADGTVDDSSPPISGFPNAITQDDFNAAWTAAGRS